MSVNSERLQHLFSRVIDGEATPAEHALFESLLARDVAVRRFFAEYEQLDAQVGAALCAAVRSEPSILRPRRRWQSTGRTLSVAIAASIAALLWLRPAPPPVPAAGHPRQASSWFAPPTVAGDALVPVTSALERPELRFGGSQRDWIVIPGSEAGEFFVIEVDRVRTHAIAVSRDF